MTITYNFFKLLNFIITQLKREILKINKLFSIFIIITFYYSFSWSDHLKKKKNYWTTIFWYFYHFIIFLFKNYIIISFITTQLKSKLISRFFIWLNIKGERKKYIINFHFLILLQFIITLLQLLLLFFKILHV